MEHVGLAAKSTEPFGKGRKKKAVDTRNLYPDQCLDKGSCVTAF